MSSFFLFYIFVNFKCKKDKENQYVVILVE